VLLADSSKYGSWSLFQAAPLQQLPDIITDRLLSDESQSELSEQDFALRLAL